MARQIRVRAIRRREVDEDKLALAFLLLARVLHEEAPAGLPEHRSDGGTTEPEAV